MYNDSFYPTPNKLSYKMTSKIKGFPNKILEPSAGKGDLIESVQNKFYRRSPEIFAIEKDENLSYILNGKNIKVIDSDFLSFSGPDKFDLIIANPPFNEGHKHLLKAIDILYTGQIIFLLNAETLKNPYSNSRKELVNKLNELNAEIEYIDDAFLDAERKTKVSVALVNIIIERKVEDDLFKDVNDSSEETDIPNIETENKELTTKNTVRDLVASYNRILNKGTETILNYYKNYRFLNSYMYIGFDNDNSRSGYYKNDLTQLLQDDINTFITKLRKDYWRKVLDIKEVNKRFTEKRKEEFEHTLNQKSYMDFTESNINQFIINVINNYEKTLTDAVVEIFDKFTIKHCFDDGLRNKNIHLFNGWKTNKAFKVNKKVIIPLYTSFGDTFIDFSGKWCLDFSAKRKLDDIDKVMNYFDSMSDYISITDAIDEAFKNRTEDHNKNIESTYFIITCYKKETIHLTFKDENILRRFNVVACKGKGFIPQDYGKKSYTDMKDKEKTIVDSFEGKDTYNKHLNQKLFANKNLLKISY